MFNFRKLAQTTFQVYSASSCPLAASVRALSSGGPSILTFFIQKSNFSSLLSRSPPARSLLASSAPVLTTQVAGLKVRYALKKRCKDCYLVVRNQRTYIMCPTHPRHKQMQPVKKPRYTWILTGASQSKERPW